jgi:hypothetical protein
MNLRHLVSDFWVNCRMIQPVIRPVTVQLFSYLRVIQSLLSQYLLNYSIICGHSIASLSVFIELFNYLGHSSLLCQSFTWLINQLGSNQLFKNNLFYQSFNHYSFIIPQSFVGSFNRFSGSLYWIIQLPESFSHFFASFYLANRSVRQ